MTPAITYADFKRRPASLKRYLLEITALNSSTLLTKKFYFSNNGDANITGSSAIWHGKCKAVPALTYNSAELNDKSTVPTFSDIVLLREDGYDVSDDRSGVYVDDFGFTWILRDQPAIVYYGGDALPFSEYQIVASGFMEGMKRTDDTLTIEFAGYENKTIRNTLAYLKADATTYPNAGTNTDRTIPFVAGFAFNMKPFIVDFTNDTYIFHDNTVPYFSINVYQDGVALTGGGVNYTDNGNGTFTLTAPATGQITCDVLGAWVFFNWATVITNILQTFAGIPLAQIDSAAVAQANIDFPILVGWVFDEEISVSDAIDTLSKGVPAWRGFQRNGVYSLAEWKDPSAATVTHTINNTRSNSSPIPFLSGSLSEKTTNIPTQTCNMEYYPNFYPVGEDRLSNILTPTQKWIFSTPWRQTFYNDATVSTLYAQATTLKKQCTTASAANALLLATKWVNLFKVERHTVVLSVKTQDLSYNIGDIVEVSFITKLRNGGNWNRHNYINKKMLLLGIREDYTTKTTTLTLWY